jgi:hypothetical protein
VARPGLGVCHPASQFASPYLAMGNRPVEMVDPDGEFALVAVAAGAIFGIATNGFINSFKNGANI